MLELIKDYVQLSNLSQPESVTAMCEFDCIIPDVLPDMTKILAVYAVAESESVDKSGAHATINFRINYKILYLSEPDAATEDKPIIKSFESVSRHSSVLESTSPVDNAVFRSYCFVENTEANFINSRKLSVKTTVRIDSCIINSCEAAICTTMSGIDDIQTQTKNVNFSCIKESISNVISIDEEIELSAGKAAYKELLRNDAMLSDVTYSFIGDKLQVKGSIEICTLYVADDPAESIQIVENEIPFTQTIETETIGESIKWRINSDLKKCRSDITRDSDGELRIMHFTAEIEVNADAFAVQDSEILSDAYSLSQVFALKTAEYTSTLISDDISGQFVLRNAISKEENLPDIFQVVNVTATLGKLTTSVEDGKISASGEIICNVLYLSDEKGTPLSSFRSVIPFAQYIDCKNALPGMMTYIQPAVNHVSFNIMSPSEIEVRIAISCSGTILKNYTFSVIDDVSQPDDPYITNSEDRPSILLYVVQPNDSLWKVAKRYNAPLELLKNINQLKNPDMILPGQKLLIPM